MSELQNREWVDLDWPVLVERIQKYATSELARHQIGRLSPLSSPTEALNSFSQIGECEVLIKKGLRPFFESLDLFFTWHKRIEKKANLKTLELKDVRHFCLEVIALNEALKEIESAWLLGLKSRLMPAEEPLSAIDQIMTPDGEIRNDASETMYKLIQEKTQQAKSVQQSLDRIVKNYDMEPVLQEKYVTTREGRWVLPVKGGMQHSLDGIIHATSQSKQTVFMEPQEIVPINNRIRQIEIEIEEEIERLLTELSVYLHTLSSDFEQTQKELLKMDVFLSKAQLSLFLKSEPCTFTEEEIELNLLRHPLLVLNGVKTIPNSVQLNSEKRILLLSGPNAGGKTVLLKSVGLAAHMSRCGLPIPAEPGSKLPFFRNIIVSVGDAQSVHDNLSTFAAHLRTLGQAVEVSGPDSLVLIDEICGSTDPEEGSALARSFLDEYASNGVFGVVTSHLGALKLGWGENSGVINGSLEFDQKAGPTYQFIMGVPGQSLAIQTAKRVGVKDSVIQKAYSYLSPEVQSYKKNLDELEMLKEELFKQQKDLEQEKKKTRGLQKKYEEALKKFDTEREKMLSQTVKRAEKKVETLIKTSKVDEIFKKHETLEKIKTEIPKVIKSKPSQSVSQKIETAEDFAKYFPPGSPVFIASMGYDGIVQGTPSSKGEVLVLSRSMRLSVPWDQLKPAENSANPTRELVRKSSSFSFSPAEENRAIDVRGLSSEDAVAKIETELDAAVLAQEDRIRIIHGHGTEALKRSIRSYLSRSMYVKKWQAGTPNTGGDGITWIEL